jgi:protein-tyrosine phosphatase
MASNPSDWAHEIIPRLWLGNFQSASSAEWLKAHQIQAVFNCTKNIPFALDPPMNMYRIPLDDNLQAEEIRNAQLWSFEAVYRLATEYNAGAHVLVHCHAGMQRSAAVVAMFIIFLTRCKPDEAIAFIKTRRPIAFLHSVNFYNAIVGFHQDYMRNITERGLVFQYPPKPIASLLEPGPPLPALKKTHTY